MKPRTDSYSDLENINYKLIQENIKLRKRLYEILKYLQSKQTEESWYDSDFNNCITILRGGKLE